MKRVADIRAAALVSPGALGGRSLRDRPREAAAVERALQQMAGRPSRGYTATGRLLVRYGAALNPQEMTALVHAASDSSAQSRRICGPDSPPHRIAT